MSFSLMFPVREDKNLDISLNVGETLFVVGANGTGKSSLMHRIYDFSSGSVRRILAHRQAWFQSSAIGMSPHEKRNVSTSISASDKHVHSRWKDDYAHYRVTISIYDLVDAENRRARLIADAIDKKNIELACSLSEDDSPLKKINQLFKMANIQIEILVSGSEEILAKKNGGDSYSIAELSDGERNALLISADVLTAKPETLLIIDEPERHLHRSIISPLLTLLFAQRPDCAFVISTHDVTLPLDNPSSRTLLLRGCNYGGSNVISWDADLLVAKAEINDELKRDILGGRRKLLFVEGTEHSLDKSLYSLLFTNISVIAKSSCRDVEQAVSGIRATQDLHWLQAFGVVDNDGRIDSDIERLRAKGVYALRVFSVESIYYNVEIQRRVVSRYSSVVGDEPEKLLEDARSSALEALQSDIIRLSERAAEHKIRKKVLNQLPKRSDISAAQPITLTIDIPSMVADEVSRLKNAYDSRDLDFVIGKYPVRETPILNRIALRLGFQGREQYESAVRKLLMDDKDALSFAQSLFEGLSVDIAS